MNDEKKLNDKTENTLDEKTLDETTGGWMSPIFKGAPERCQGCPVGWKDGNCVERYNCERNKRG